MAVGPSLLKLLSARDPNDPLAFLGMGAGQTTSGIQAPRINPEMFNSRPSMLSGFDAMNSNIADMVANNRAADQATFEKRKAEQANADMLKKLQLAAQAGTPLQAKPMNLKKPKPGKKKKPKNKEGQVKGNKPKKKGSPGSGWKPSDLPKPGSAPDQPNPALPSLEEIQKKREEQKWSDYNKFACEKYGVGCKKKK